MTVEDALKALARRAPACRIGYPDPDNGSFIEIGSLEPETIDIPTGQELVVVAVPVPPEAPAETTDGGERHG